MTSDLPDWVKKGANARRDAHKGNHLVASSIVTIKNITAKGRITTGDGDQFLLSSRSEDPSGAVTYSRDGSLGLIFTLREP